MLHFKVETPSVPTLWSVSFRFVILWAAVLGTTLMATEAGSVSRHSRGMPTSTVASITACGCSAGIGLFLPRIGVADISPARFSH